MRLPAPDTRPVGLTIAGSDSGGGAGIQADLATMAAYGVFGTSVITAVTAQHTRGVERSFTLPLEEVTAQLEAVLEDFEVGAAKTGMLARTDLVEELAARAPGFDFPLVVDPVMVATSGDRLLESAAERAYEDLIAESTLVTPNADEAEVLTGISVEDDSSAQAAGEYLCDLGADAALLKGGHVPGESVRDVLVVGTEDGHETVVFEHPRVDTDATHGTGCALSAAITANLATGADLETATEEATDFLARAVRYHYDIGKGPGAVNHTVGIRTEVAKAETAASLSRVADRFVAEDVSALVPEGGMDLVGATPYAETVDEVAAVDGGLRRTDAGVDPAGRVRFGTANPLTNRLLEIRERYPSVHVAARCRLSPAVERALEDLEWHSTMDDRSDGEEPPVAIIDRRSAETEATTTVLADTSEEVRERVLTLCEHVELAEE